MKSSFRTWSRSLVMVACALVAACSVKVPFDDLGDASISVDASAVLRGLFPDLSPEEILKLATSLTASELAALKADLDEARAEAAKLSAGLDSLASSGVEQRNGDLA